MWVSSMHQELKVRRISFSSNVRKVCTRKGPYTIAQHVAVCVFYYQKHKVFVFYGCITVHLRYLLNSWCLALVYPYFIENDFKSYVYNYTSRFFPSIGTILYLSEILIEVFCILIQIFVIFLPCFFDVGCDKSLCQLFFCS